MTPTFLLKVFPAPSGAWSQAALQLVATLLDAALADMPTADLRASRHGGDDSIVTRDTYCERLAPELLGIADAASNAPPLAAALARCGFGRLALQLACAECDVLQCRPWVRRDLVAGDLLAEAGNFAEGFLPRLACYHIFCLV